MTSPSPTTDQAPGSASTAAAEDANALDDAATLQAGEDQALPGLGLDHDALDGAGVPIQEAPAPDAPAPDAPVSDPAPAPEVTIPEVTVPVVMSDAPVSPADPAPADAPAPASAPEPLPSNAPQPPPEDAPAPPAADAGRAPAPVIEVPGDGEILDELEVTISGTVDTQAGGTVKVMSTAGRALGTASVEGTGDWSISTTLVNGDYSVYAQATTDGGLSNQSETVAFTVEHDPTLMADKPRTPDEILAGFLRRRVLKGYQMTWEHSGEVRQAAIDWLEAKGL
jgi:hypothetical protein